MDREVVGVCVGDQLIYDRILLELPAGRSRPLGGILQMCFKTKVLVCLQKVSWYSHVNLLDL